MDGDLPQRRFRPVAHPSDPRLTRYRLPLIHQLAIAENRSLRTRGSACCPGANGSSRSPAAPLPAPRPDAAAHAQRPEQLTIRPIPIGRMGHLLVTAPHPRRSGATHPGAVQAAGLIPQSCGAPMATCPIDPTPRDLYSCPRWSARCWSPWSVWRLASGAVRITLAGRSGCGCESKSYGCSHVACTRVETGAPENKGDGQ